MAKPRKTKPPLLDTAEMVGVFATPAKKSRQAVAIKAQRQRYISLTIEGGIPPNVAKLVCNRYSSPRKINEVLSRWTGRCSKLGVALTDAGTQLDSATLVQKDGTFVSKLSRRFQGGFTDKELLGLCTLVYNRHHGSTSTTHLGRINSAHHDNSHTSGLSGAAVQPSGASKQSVPVGLF